MGRKLAFDKDKALEVSMHNFWAKGYGATSMRDLADSLGLHLGSVYNTLGDKEKVFEAALRLNLEKHVLPRTREFGKSANAPEALRLFLEEVSAECHDPKKNKGCFLFNSLQHITDINDDITRVIHDCLEEIENIFTDFFTQAQENGHVSREKKPRTLARYLLSVVYSMRVLSKLKVPTTTVEEVKAFALVTILG
jgi:TetR/AcrR family transcriptional regulator, transcriptional repressor for nem operon